MSCPQIPPATATVTEFRCVFTRNPRRKQKTWIDGRLEFHAFNQRVIVRDERGNLVGDAHWRSQRGLEDGDELELDRGYLVQVLDSVGSREQDISSLWTQKLQRAHAAKSSQSPHKGSSDAASHNSPPYIRQCRDARPRVSGLQLSALQTPRPIQYPSSARPNPPVSSFQPESPNDGEDDMGDRPLKRRKMQEKSCHSRALFGATLALTAGGVAPVSSSSPSSKRTLHMTNSRPDAVQPGNILSPATVARPAKRDVLAPVQSANLNSDDSEALPSVRDSGKHLLSGNGDRSCDSPASRQSNAICEALLDPEAPLGAKKSSRLGPISHTTTEAPVGQPAPDPDKAPALEDGGVENGGGPTHKDDVNLPQQDPPAAQAKTKERLLHPKPKRKRGLMILSRLQS